MKTGIQIGPAEDVAASVSKAINTIIMSKNSDEVKIKALKALTQSCRVDNVAVSGCNIMEK